MPTIDVPGATLDYTVSGRGPSVVQLHGLTSCRARDRALGLDLGRALPRQRLLRYDARGHGASTGVTHAAGYAWHRLADDLLALLDHVFPRSRVHGVGPSMGTGTLLHAAVRDPGRFASLTLVIPPTAWETRRSQAEAYRANADLVEREGLGAFLDLGSTAPGPPALEGAPQTVPSVDEALLPTLLRGAAATDLPPHEVLAQIDVPVLVLAWTGDPSHPIRTAEVLEDLLPDSRLVVARSPADVLSWPGLFAQHVTSH